MERPDAIFVIYIETTPARLWTLLASADASPGWFFGNRMEIGGAPGDPFRVTRPDGTIDVDGGILAIEPGKRLRVSWAMPGNPLGEGRPNEVEFLIDPAGEGVVRLSVLEYHHLPVPDAWKEAGRQGWSLILSSLKTRLEPPR